MSVQQITISAVTKESKSFGSEVIWGVKVGDSWMDLHVTEKPSKGQSPTVETWETEGKDGRKFVHARPVAGQQPAQPAAPSQQQARPAVQSPNGNRATYAHSFDEYATVARKAHAFALELEPGEAGARGRTALVSTFLIAFGDGQFALPVEDEWEDVTPGTGIFGPVKYEKTAAHDHLNKVAWVYCERTGKTADECRNLIIGYAKANAKIDIKDVLELSEKQAIQTRLALEQHIDENTDYKALFSIEARKIAKLEGWDFDGEPIMTAEQKKILNDKKKAILMKAKMKSPAATATQQEWKDAVGELTDDIPF